MNRLALTGAASLMTLALPLSASATPATVANLRTVAVAAEPTSTTTTEVTVEVTSEPAATPPPPKPAPPPPPTPEQLRQWERADQVRKDRKSGRGLIISGAMVSGVSYLFTSLAGALAIDRARDMVDDPDTLDVDESARADDRRRFGRALLIPGIGPGLAIARADTATRAWAAGVAGLTQGLGAGLVVLGIARLGRAKRLERLNVTGMASSRGAQVSVGLRF
ncbi:MAG: hypothetical protein AAF799_23370 [Myxococcota bacterium]